MARKSKTKAEREHHNKVVALGCIVCVNLGLGETPAHVHHIRSGAGMGQKSSHFDVIPLCPCHHQYGGKIEGIEHYGYHQSPESFEREYGTELELLEQVRSML